MTNLDLFSADLIGAAPRTPARRAGPRAGRAPSASAPDSPAALALAAGPRGRPAPAAAPPPGCALSDFCAEAAAGSGLLCAYHWSLLPPRDQAAWYDRDRGREAPLRERLLGHAAHRAGWVAGDLHPRDPRHLPGCPGCAVESPRWGMVPPPRPAPGRSDLSPAALELLDYASQVQGRGYYVRKVSKFTEETRRALAGLGLEPAGRSADFSYTGMVDSHPTGPIVAGELDRSFREYVATSLARAARAECREVPWGDVARTLWPRLSAEEAALAARLGFGPGGAAVEVATAAGEEEDESPPAIEAADLAADEPPTSHADLEPQPPGEFRRAANRRLWRVRTLARVRPALDRDAADRARLAAALRAGARPDAAGNVVDPETGEVLAGPHSPRGLREAREARRRAEAARALAEGEAERARRRAAWAQRDRARTAERGPRAGSDRGAWGGADAPYCAAEAARIDRLRAAERRA